MEDDQTTAKALSAILQRRGWGVSVAPTVSAAITALAGDGYAWVILDLMLPDGQGETVLRQIRAAGLRARVIITTGCNDQQRLRELQSLAPYAVFHKPIELSQLCRMIEGHFHA